MSTTLVHGHSPDQLDSAWKCALEYLPVECLTLCFPAIAATLDLSRRFTVLDAELHQPADGAAANAGACHADRVWRCIANDGRPVILHIEIQCQRAERFAERMFIYLALLFAKYRLPVISLAILGDESATWRPDEFGFRFGSSSLSMHFGTCKLLDLEASLPLALDAGHGFALFIAAHLQTIRTRREPLARLAAKCRLTEILHGQGWSDGRRAQMFDLLDRIMQLPPALDAQYRQHFAKEYHMYVSLWDRYKKDLREEWRRQTAEQVARERAQGRQQGFEKGREEGREEGRGEGREEGRRMMLLDLAEQRFGPLPRHIGTKLSMASPDEVQRLTKRICVASTIEDLLD